MRMFIGYQDEQWNIYAEPANRCRRNRNRRCLSDLTGLNLVHMIFEEPPENTLEGEG
jgi:hypothetical protein